MCLLKCNKTHHCFITWDIRKTVQCNVCNFRCLHIKCHIRICTLQFVLLMDPPSMRVEWRCITMVNEHGHVRAMQLQAGGL